MALRMGSCSKPRERPSLGTLASILISTLFTPGTVSTAWRASLSILVRNGQAGVVRTIVKFTWSPAI